MARDAKHISIGVDGKNGLRGSLELLVKDMSGMTEDLEFLRQSAHSYNETKAVLLKLFATSAMAILIQFAAAVWCVSAINARQDSIRQDVNRVLTLIDKLHIDQPQTNK
jgi:hypothetical protein